MSALAHLHSQLLPKQVVTRRDFRELQNRVLVLSSKGQVKGVGVQVNEVVVLDR
jgi:hypothetical protein